VKLEVLTIGTELLLGYTVDTNAAELGRSATVVRRVISAPAWPMPSTAPGS
jgi:hypothetical protein